jgi:hypothetical protein
MTIRNKAKIKKVDLLEMKSPERMQLIEELREKLQLKIAEAKLWQSLLEVENLTINGNTVYRGCEPLNGF